MNKVTLGLVIVAMAAIALLWNTLFNRPKTALTTPGVDQAQTAPIEPSTSLKSYADESGFEFSYPDNLSLASNEATSSAVYADIDLTAKGVSGKLNLKIANSKFKTLEDWSTSVSLQPPTETKLGDLRALQISSNDGVILGSLDSGVLFIVEASFGDRKDFWESVKKSISKDFSFAQPTKDTPSSGDNSSDQGVSFEGDEVVQ